ncbi:MAG TPA: DUF998 domain-containing protein [Stackebrandtia sp.]|jgi:hypothetical protein|uniref:DUF998 domain-containing protein n=1 Tax=Stackebrandtia sp. TaxID=2023065 RepID=UPI002D6E349F|nr:DUF998 domain-containing protein [Stackebrandtia sp.]HZE38353.1 DUF998 domain-containing protein [Stackebrandtia sp.]
MNAPVATGLTWQAKVAIAGSITGTAIFALLHLLMAGPVSPVSEPVSNYALTPPGNVLFALAVLGFASGCAALSLLPAPGLPRVLLGVTSLALLVAVMVPTDSGDGSSLNGQVHRYAAGTAFVVLTLTGAWIWLWGDGGRLVGLVTVAAAVTLAFSSMNTLFPGVLDGGAWRGIPQRAHLAIHAVLLVVLALLPRRAPQPRPATALVRARPGLVATPTPATIHDGEKLWLTSRGIPGRGALPSADGLRPRTLRRQ